MNSDDIYNSCKKLLFKVDLKIKNAKGELVLNKSLGKLSEIFDEENRPLIASVCQELTHKAKIIVEEKEIANNDNDAIL